MIYFDNNATTQLDPLVLQVMVPFLENQYGNPSSIYSFGRAAAKAVATAREQVAALLRCQPSEIVFTSCGTESDNSAIQSALLIDPDRKHLVTSKVEHSAIIKHAEALARRGYEVTWLDVDSNGMIDLNELESAIREDTAIVSLMWANNETGVLFPIEEAAEICRSKGTLFHTDAVQAVGKIDIDLGRAPISLLSLSGHKLHAPKGVAALYVNRRTKFNPYLLGGGQENKKRGGTENTASIVALGRAAELAFAALKEERVRVKALRDRFEEGLLENVSSLQINGDRTRRLPNTSNVAIEGVDSEGMLMLLDQRGICCSAGSACTAGSLEPSHVLKAMGFSNDHARGSLRFSFSRFNSQPEVERALQIIPNAVEKLRSMSRGFLAA
ncbi:MAG TPA: cysteine desulfurase NifS [Chthoniobacterales bacterium]|jgi:cysteine desulfurase|nr:cysteine desulfurase NifS [Chthoniobacterales bacterium]